MIHHASCNYDLFAVPDGSTGFRTIGGTNQTTSRLEYRGENLNQNAVMRSENRDGNIWGWSYSGDEFDLWPEYHVIVNTWPWTASYIYETETRIDPNFILTDNWNDNVEQEDRLESENIEASESGINKNLVYVRCLPINDPMIISGLQDLVLACTLPEWVATSKYVGISTPANTLIFLWNDICAQYGLYPYSSMLQMDQEEPSLMRKMLGSMLWLRCVSSLLCGHSDQLTAIPLLKSRFRFDENGIPSLVL